MSPSNWKDLGNPGIRDALLLAEVAAWLHDMGKCADEHIINQASDKPKEHSYRYKTAQSHRIPAGLSDIRLASETVSVKELIEKGRPRAISTSTNPWLLRVLGKCHAVAHVEKELSDRETATKQQKDNTRLSTAFGHEGNPVKGLTALLDALPFQALTDRVTFVPQTKQAFDQALGDTRRPINEVTLADWSDTVAALYKSALAGALLGVKPDPDSLRWRLLRVNFDVLGLYAKAVKIADLLGYQRAVEEACEAVKKLIEEEYPLGNEIYRDTTGIYFIFPDLDLPADLEQEIRRRVEEVEPELAPRIAVTVGKGETATEQLKGILAKARKEALEALAQPFDGQNLSDYWQQQWSTAGTSQSELCPVCRLRPKAESKDACEHCEKRRQGRVSAWRTNPQDTIWVNEIADPNGRLALIVGKFGLDDWLSGDLVQTMLVKADPQSNTFTPKNPSPARLRRVWETAQRFWVETVTGDILPKWIGQRPRYRIVPREKQDWKTSPAYNGRIGDKPIDLFWDGAAFLTISNLEWLLSEEERQGDRRAALEKALQPGTSITLDDPDDPRRKRTVTIERAEPAPGEFAEYRPWLRLLSTPDQFLALIPAADAIAIVQAIRDEYEKQFDKVCNRLPLHLGLIFFDRKMPLMAVLDAGRAMLERTPDDSPWTVTKTGSDLLPDDNPRCVHLTLARDGHEIGIEIPTVMGDGATFDPWYPYWRVEGKPTDRRHWFIGPDGEHWVHVGELWPDDIVHFTPSTFDFEYLDSASRRFAIAYENGRRFDRPTRPFLLEDLERLETVWSAFCQLSQTQRKQVLATIETARERWFGRDEAHQSAGDETFRRFVADTLANAAWNWKKTENREQLVAAAVRGELADLAELHQEILKEK